MKSLKLLAVLSVIALTACNPTTKSSSVAPEGSDSSYAEGSLSCSCYDYGSSSSQASSENNVSSQTDAVSSSVNASSSQTSSAISSSKETSSSAASSSSEAQSSSASTTSNPPDPVGVFHKVVTFYNGGFTNSSLEQPASRQQFIDWFNNGENVLNSITYEAYAQLNYIGNQNDTWRFSTLILGSQSSNGKITFNLNVQALSVKVVVQPYTKYIAYTNSYNVDTNATFLVDSQEYDLSLEEGYSGETENVTIEHTFGENPVSSFSISNKDAKQRVFVHSLDITYWG